MDKAIESLGYPVTKSRSIVSRLFVNWLVVSNYSWLEVRQDHNDSIIESIWVTVTTEASLMWKYTKPSIFLPTCLHKGI